MNHSTNPIHLNNGEERECRSQYGSNSNPRSTAAVQKDEHNQASCQLLAGRTISSSQKVQADKLTTPLLLHDDILDHQQRMRNRRSLLQKRSLSESHLVRQKSHSWADVDIHPLEDSEFQIRTHHHRSLLPECTNTFEHQQHVASSSRRTARDTHYRNADELHKKTVRIDKSISSLACYEYEGEVTHLRKSTMQATRRVSDSHGSSLSQIEDELTVSFNRQLEYMDEAKRSQRNSASMIVSFEDVRKTREERNSMRMKKQAPKIYATSQNLIRNHRLSTAGRLYDSLPNVFNLKHLRTFAGETEEKGEASDGKPLLLPSKAFNGDSRPAVVVGALQRDVWVISSTAGSTP